MYKKSKNIKENLDKYNSIYKSIEAKIDNNFKLLTQKDRDILKDILRKIK